MKDIKNCPSGRKGRLKTMGYNTQNGSLDEDIEMAKRNYIKMFSDLVADEELTTEKIRIINQMIAIILSF